MSQSNSDYQGLEHLEERSNHQVYHRLQIYAGVRSLIIGSMPQGFRIHEVRGHADADAATSDRERLEAIGNDHADRVAKSAAAEQRAPSTGELQEWGRQAAFLKGYLQYVPKALALWPAVGPPVGKSALPRREQGGQRVKGQVTFAADVFGPLRLRPEPPQTRAQRQ